MVASCNECGIAKSSSAFLFIWRLLMIEGYLTINEVAKKWDISPRRVRAMCLNGQIPKAAKLGRVWAIPQETERPVDGRVTSGEYRDWRKKNKEENRTVG